MQQEDDDAPEGSSVRFVYESGVDKIREQLGLIDSLDVKMGVLIGFLGALIVGFLAALLAASSPALTHLLNREAKGLLGAAALLVAASLYFAFQAFRMRRYQSGARFQDLYEWAKEETEKTQEEFLPTLLETVDLNDLQLKRKPANAQRAVLSVFLALWLLLAGECIIAIRML